ncbi:sulfurtransferase TusD [Bacterioplanes sanyensis]|uniref:sulfurtransferase complex subunit TusD n=1 Tax=Bacterioplanes sanyensis TaxID=1249553 RepID=UPI00167B78CB|nr:sulfurtransferase complex subunit TusD [Bacterioplanes sanyensis]GGY41359.1 sulfurtransferase TusD [Bacterioplanes sanyensis]
MATLTLLIRRSPYIGHGHQTALAFASAALDAGHAIKRVFFYQDAVLAAMQQQPPQGQAAISQQWQSLAARGVTLQVCIANALRRGVVDEREAQRYDCQATLAPDFVLAGLGEMASASEDSDRIVEF